MKHVPLTDLSQATFAGLLNTKFRVHRTPPAMVELELTEAMAGPSGPALANSGSFSLIFLGPLDTFFPQGTYLFEHEKLGAFDLFIVPIGKTPTGFRYEVIFNRAG